MEVEVNGDEGSVGLMFARLLVYQQLLLVLRENEMESQNARS